MNLLNILLATKKIKKLDHEKRYYLLIKDAELLDNEMKDKFSNSIKKRVDCGPAYDEKYLKTKGKSNERKINIVFRGDKIPKERCQCIFLSVIVIDSVFRTGTKYYPRVFLEESKYIIKEKKMAKYITCNIEISHYSDEENSDEKYLKAS